jgi:hypothetical protein
VKSWFGYIHPGAIDDEESRYIDCHDDLIPVQPPEGRHGLYSFFEKIVLLMGTTRPYFSRRPREYDVIDVGEETIYVDEKKIGFICSWVIAIIVLIMLIGPLWILEYVNGNVLKLGVITCFITLFAILIAATTASSKTTSRAFGSLVATTAYSAVLVFFLQFGSANRN